MIHTAEVVFGIFLLVFFIKAGVEIIRSLRERVDAVAWKVDSIESTMKQLDQKIEEVIDCRFNYSLTNVMYTMKINCLAMSGSVRLRMGIG